MILPKGAKTYAVAFPAPRERENSMVRGECGEDNQGRLRPPNPKKERNLNIETNNTPTMGTLSCLAQPAENESQLKSELGRRRSHLLEHRWREGGKEREIEGLNLEKSIRNMKWKMEEEENRNQRKMIQRRRRDLRNATGALF
jgi:hypothetical protein